MSQLDEFGTGANLAQNYAQAEQEAFDEWAETYSRNNPLPDIPRTGKIFSLAYWDFWALAFVSGASIFLTATRTGLRFYEAAFSDSNTVWLASLEALLAIFAVDLGLPVVAAVFAYRRILKSQSATRLWVERLKLVIASVLLLAIIVVAGLGQSIKISQSLLLQYGLLTETWLVLLLGGGIGIVAFIFGDLLGVTFASVAVDNKTAIEEYEIEVEEYYEARAEAWISSPQYNSLRLQYSQMEKSHRKMIREGYQSPEFLPREIPGENGYPSQSDLAYEYLSGHPESVEWHRDDDVPSDYYIAQALKSSNRGRFSNASAGRGRRRWIKENL
jgi:hypothetical protein